MVVILIETTNLLRFFSPVAAVRGQRGIAHCRASPCPVHCRSTIVACCGIDAEFASAPANGRRESVRCRGSGAAVSSPYVSGSPPTTRGVGFVATPAIHPVADRAARLGDGRRHAGSCATIPRDSAQHRPGSRNRQSPSRDTAIQRLQPIHHPV